MALISTVAGWGAQQAAKKLFGSKKKRRKIVNATAARFSDAHPTTRQTFTGPPVPDDYEVEMNGKTLTVDEKTGALVEKRRRRRRKQLLTSSDRQDIAFIVGTLGKGQMGQAAISQLLARACN
jgi:hypothetical protein